MALRTVAPLLRRRADDDKAFERLYERHVRSVYRYAAAMLGDPSDAEDVTQTTFLNAYRAFTSGTRPEKPQSWLIAIAHNVCRQRFRQAQRRPHEVAFDERIGDGLAAEEITAPSAEDLRRALSQLPPNQRAAIVMRELEGGSYAQIADVLGISVSALETLLFRARRALREQLEEQLTCQEAAFAINKQLDGRLSLGERRALRAHLRACAECNSLAQSQRAQRRALKALVLIPLPATVSHWMGHQTAAAATAGTGGLTAAGVGGTAGGGAAGASSFALGGVAVKVAAVVVAGVVAGGTYEGVKHAVRHHARTAQKPVTHVHIVTGSSPGLLTAYSRMLDTPKSAAPSAALPEQASARAHARAHRAHKRNNASTPSPSTIPPGQVVKAIATTQPHALRTNPPGKTVSATHAKSKQTTTTATAKNANGLAHRRSSTTQSNNSGSSNNGNNGHGHTGTTPSADESPVVPHGQQKSP